MNASTAIAVIQTEENTKLRKALQELQQERDELAAHCEELRLNLGWYIETVDIAINNGLIPAQNVLRERAYASYKS